MSTDVIGLRQPQMLCVLMTHEKVVLRCHSNTPLPLAMSTVSPHSVAHVSMQATRHDQQRSPAIQIDQRGVFQTTAQWPACCRCDAAQDKCSTAPIASCKSYSEYHDSSNSLRFDNAFTTIAFHFCSSGSLTAYNTCSLDSSIVCPNCFARCSRTTRLGSVRPT